jgi:peptide/nickel transport system substrate-binding protein
MEKAPVSLSPLALPTVDGATTVPVQGDTFVEGVAGYPQSINPLFSELNDVDRDLSALIYEGLTTVNERNEIVPLLADRWEISQDGLTYTFFLREGTRWQDGQPFTADDVAFTIGLLQSPDFPGLPHLSELWRSIEVEVVDPLTIQFTLYEPYAPFLDYTTIGLVPRHALEDVPVATLDQAPFNYAPIGTGLFRLEELTEDHALLVTNPYHPLWARTVLDRVEFRFYPTHEDILTAYEAGEVMGVSRIVAKDMQRARSDPGLQILSARLSGYSLIFLNLNNPEVPFLQDQQVRQALLYALDRQGLSDRVLGGHGLVVHSPIMPQSWAYNPRVKRYNYDPYRARKLLEEAGWELPDPKEIALGELGPVDRSIRSKEGQPLEFTLLTNDVPDRVALAHAIAEQWADVGMRVQVEAVDAAELAEDHLLPRTFHALLSQWQSLPPDPDPYPVWHSTQVEGSGQNYSSFIDRDADEAIEVARQLTDPQQRTELYHQFQEIFADQVPAILLYQAVYSYGVHGQVHNVQIAPMPDPSGRFRSVEQWAVLREKEVLLCDLNDQVGDRLDKRSDP